MVLFLGDSKWTDLEFTGIWSETEIQLCFLTADHWSQLYFKNSPSFSHWYEMLLLLYVKFLCLWANLGGPLYCSIDLSIFVRLSHSFKYCDFTVILLSDRAISLSLLFFLGFSWLLVYIYL